jgi:predicted AAA+ superfamily ATPase
MASQVLFVAGERVSQAFFEAARCGGACRHAHRHLATLTRAEYLALVAAGGYPEAVRRMPNRRKNWYDAYLTAIVNRDASTAAGLERLSLLPGILELIAARSGSERFRGSGRSDSTWLASLRPNRPESLNLRFRLSSRAPLQ